MPRQRSKQNCLSFPSCDAKLTYPDTVTGSTSLGIPPPHLQPSLAELPRWTTAKMPRRLYIILSSRCILRRRRHTRLTFQLHWTCCQDTVQDSPHHPPC